MRADILPTRTHRRSRRSTGDRLRDAVLTLCAGHGQVQHHTEKAWASITFAGTRHCLRIVFEGGDAVQAGEDLVATLPDHEFAIPRQLVADATITAVESELLPVPRMLVECELLLLEDA
ncbi:hypothetical protein [Parerythrobacter jejuensis]|uniref:Uncharacterized protein n=1 Tax=Parerythrobacter jejuensis TaxID=795812 RepID=A0A845B1H8_9SPHN|nr:hypothetical protein [Parerythrobacter jejuensis]MXP32838.1 hypothetical protein [Parerythrobacter jejuensis]